MYLYEIKDAVYFLRHVRWLLCTFRACSTNRHPLPSEQPFWHAPSFLKPSVEAECPSSGGLVWVPRCAEGVWSDESGSSTTEEGNGSEEAIEDDDDGRSCNDSSSASEGASDDEGGDDIVLEGNSLY